MQNKQECVAWGVGLCQLLEPLAQSMHLYFTVCINVSTNLGGLDPLAESNRRIRSASESDPPLDQFY